MGARAPLQGVFYHFSRRMSRTFFLIFALSGKASAGDICLTAFDIFIGNVNLCRDTRPRVSADGQWLSLHALSLRHLLVPRKCHRLRAAGTAIAVTGGEIFFFLSVCGARQPLRLTKQACVLPTAAHTALALDSATGGGQARGPPSFARTSQMPPPSQREAFHYRRLRFAYPPRGRLRGLRVLTMVLAGQ